MYNKTNISGCCLSTFYSAGNGVFSFCENIDNQHCYDCANSTAFTGKERDAETGYSYFGARYYDSDLSGLFLSVDPMSDKYPNISPYAYCAWNPVKLVDPDGDFGVPTHIEIVKKALKNHDVGSNAMRSLLYGAGRYSDWFHPSNSSFHMDNMKGTESIIKLYNDHRNGFSKNMDKGEYVAAGANLHAIADFYSHSNYVDLFLQYAVSRGESIQAGEIKPFSEMMDNSDFMDFVDGHGGLKTGTFSIGGWTTEKLHLKNPEPGSHTLMNLDDNKSLNGGSLYDEKTTKHEAAIIAAQKETNKLINANITQ